MPTDVPKIDILYTNTPDPQVPMGARGIGEIGITGGGAAVANAVHNATGIRVRDLTRALQRECGLARHLSAREELSREIFLGGQRIFDGAEILEHLIEAGQPFVDGSILVDKKRS